MSRLVLNRNGGAADEYGHLLGLSRLLGASGGIIEGLNVTAPGSVMAVTVNPGSAAIPTGSSPGNYCYFVACDTSGGESVTIATAPSGNPRIDVIVAYVDKAVTAATSPVNNPAMLKFAAVVGTANASPVPPNGTTIQAAVGAGNPYTIIYNVAVAVGVTQITSANLTDVRPMAHISTGIVTAEVLTTESTSSTSYVDLTTTTDSVTFNVGASGKALVFISAVSYNPTAGAFCYVSYTLAGNNTASSIDNGLINKNATANQEITQTVHVLLSGLNPGPTTIKLKYKTNAGTATFYSRRVTVEPK